MHGFGTYVFTSGAVYTGQWREGMMHGHGKMVNADGTSYEGDWCNNLMHGEGSYTDNDEVRWDGIFIDGSYESKIQKKLRVEKEIENKVSDVKHEAYGFFQGFLAAAQQSTSKHVLGQFFASPDTTIDYVAEPYTKFETRSGDTWVSLIESAFTEDCSNLRVLRLKEDSSVIEQECVLVEQLRSKKGGQIVEFDTVWEEKTYEFAIC